MEDEISKFLKVWFIVFVSLIYCHAIGKKIPKGKTRFLLLLPIICLFLYLPLKLSTIHLGGMTAFFIAWLANFKLLLFAFNKGPLSTTNPSISLPSFLAVSCLPIKIQENPYLKSQNNQNPSPKISKETKKIKKSQSPLIYAIKVVVMGILIRVFDYNEYIHPKIIFCLYFLHIYFFLEIILAMFGFLVRTTLRVELEPPFNEPYLSSSLQDFWGRRWNLMVSNILRSTVYEPTLTISTRVIDQEWARILAVLATFFVSGIMHELIFFYLGRVKPTWEVTWFFILHAFCMVAELLLKKKVIKGRWRLPRLIAGILTVGFVLETGFWLFLPQFLWCRADVRALEELAALCAFVKNSSRAFFGPVITSLE